MRYAGETHNTDWYDAADPGVTVRCRCGREWILNPYPDMLQCDCGVLLAERKRRWTPDSES